jgi:hypothetical protein
MDQKATPVHFATLWVQSDSITEAGVQFDKRVNQWLAAGYQPVGGVSVTERSDGWIVFSIAVMKPAVLPTINLLDTEEPGAPSNIFDPKMKLGE